MTRLTFGPTGSFLPHWTPDGRAIIFVSDRNLYRKASDGTGNDERLTTSTQFQRPNAISPDGTRLVIEQEMPAAGFDLMVVSLNGPGPGVSSRCFRRHST